MKYIKVPLFLVIVIILLCSFKPSVGNIKSVQKALNKDYPNKSVELVNKGNGVYNLMIDNQSAGKVYFRELTPKAESFTYAVALANDGTILKLLFIDYHSPHGVPVTKQQWSNKLKGKRPSELSVNNNVDAVSGATLTINSLLKDLNSIK